MAVKEQNVKVVCNAAGSVQVLFQAVMGLRQHSPQVKPLGCVPIHDGLDYINTHRRSSH